MLNYVSAEFYKVFRRKYPYIAMLILCALAFLLAAGYAFTNANGNHIDFYGGGTTAVMMLTMGLFLTILVGDMVFSDQYKFNTLKNEVSFGLSRTRVYLGKLAVEAVMGVGMSLLLVAFFEVVCYVWLLPSSPENVRLTLEIVGYCVLAAMPQWLGMLAVTNMFFFLMRGNTLASFLTVGVIVGPGTVFELAGLLLMDSRPKVAEALLFLKDCMPSQMINGAPDVVGDWSYIGKSWFIGAIWVVVCTAIGLAGFRRKEIN